MFGYVKPYLPYLYGKDNTLYNAVYCCICKSIYKECGNLARLGLTYDIAFLSVFAHNISGTDVSVNSESCILHHIVKKPIAKVDDISRKLANLNTILVYYKLKDDVTDEKKGGVKTAFIKSAFKKAKAKYPEYDRIVKKYCQVLRDKELNRCEVVDEVADSSALMLKEISNYTFGEYATQYTDDLFYYIGKWVYLIDALDDYDKDVKKGNYNVLYNCFKSSDYKTLLEEHVKDVEFIFSDIFANLYQNFSQIKFKFNKDLIENIITRGLPNTTNTILNKGKEKNA